MTAPRAGKAYSMTDGRPRGVVHELDWRMRLVCDAERYGSPAKKMNNVTYEAVTCTRCLNYGQGR